MIMLLKRWPYLILAMSSSEVETVQAAGLTDPVWEGNSNFETEIKFKAKINLSNEKLSLESHRADNSTAFLITDI